MGSSIQFEEPTYSNHEFSVKFKKFNYASLDELQRAELDGIIGHEFEFHLFATVRGMEGIGLWETLIN